jgi:ribosomal protein S18 acetylase RimI-like enzyme
MPFRRYTAADRAACLAIFDSNAARFFAPGDRQDFLRFLDAPPGFYGVLCDDGGTVLGCGGLATAQTDARVAALTWGMVHADHHRRGLGRLLALARLRLLHDLPHVEKVVLHTSQETVGFYRKLGFRDVSVRVNGYRQGLDRHDLELVVDTRLRQSLANDP